MFTFFCQCPRRHHQTLERKLLYVRLNLTLDNDLVLRCLWPDRRLGEAKVDENKEMEGSEEYNCFDAISDDVLLKIFLYLPRKHWGDVSKVCQRFRNVCHDKEIFR